MTSTVALSPKTFRKLRNIVGKSRCSADPEDLACYAYDATGRFGRPEAVVFPQNTAAVAAVLALANAERVFVTPRGSGSGLSGGALAVRGGVVLVMSRFNRIRRIDTVHRTAEVEPGVVTGRLHQAAEKAGLFYPPDPASAAFSTIGGNLAECAGGPRALKYGVTRDYVLGVEAVLPSGAIINTEKKTSEGVTGYDLTRLLIGSEGTLAVITRATLRLLPLPPAVGTLAVFFGDLTAAVSAVSRILQHSVLPRTIEYLDSASLRCVAEYLKTEAVPAAGAMLLIEVDGAPARVEAETRTLARLCRDSGARKVRIAADPTEAALLWKARKAISPALFQYAPDKINEDIVVPRRHLADMVGRIETLRRETGLTMASFGHVGDGNIHFNIMLDKKNAAAARKARAAVDRIFRATLELGGTISGEHGVGVTKRSYLPAEIGRRELALMKHIKQLFDPNGILNPGKIF